MSLWALVREYPEDVYLQASPLLHSLLQEIYLKKWQQELGSEWVFLLKLCKSDRNKSIESICNSFQETTATVIETLWEEHQSNKSHLFQLPLHIVEDIQNRLFNDMQTTLGKWNCWQTRLDQDLVI